MALSSIFTCNSSGLSAGRDLIFQLSGPANGSSSSDPKHNPAAGLTPLHLAAVCNLDEVIRRLVGCHGVDVNAMTSDGITALHLAAARGHDTCVRELLEYPDVNVNASCMSHAGGLTPLHAANTSSVVEILLSRPEIDVNARNDSGDTVLYTACISNRDSIVELLLQHKNVDVHSRTDIGASVLHAVAVGGSVSIYQLLIGRHPDIDVNAQVAWGKLRGFTPLQVACTQGHIALFKELLRHPKINVMAGSVESATAIALAASNGYTEIVSDFLDLTSSIDPVRC